MNDSLHITERLRALLQRFYDGTSTPDEEREIALLLHTPEGSSDEFATDRQLFDALNAPAAEQAAPAALGKKLEEMTESHFRKTGLRIGALLRWGLAAAVAACVAGLLLMLPAGKPEVPAQEEAPLTAQASLADTVPEEKTPAEIIKTAPAEDLAEARTSERTPKAPAPKARPRVVQQHPRQIAATETPEQAVSLAEEENAGQYLTPEQAARVSEAALMAMARTLASADGVYRQADERIATTVSVTLSRLQSAELQSESNI